MRGKENNIIASISAIFEFGKYENLSISDVIEIDPSYIKWSMMNVEDFILDDNAIDEIKLLYPDFIISAEFEKKRQEKISKVLYDFYDDEEPDIYEIEASYERYSGTYAQDVAGLSDEDIDDILDGEPDAYWNID